MKARSPARATFRIAILLVTAATYSALDPIGAVARQAVGPELHDRGPPMRWELGAGLLRAQPLGEFAEYVTAGTGFGLSGLRTLGAGGFALRLDLTLISYGKTSEAHSLVLMGTVIDVDLVTENVIATLAIGPELAFGQGPVRPYIGVSMGSAQFVTTTAAWSGDRTVPIASTEAFERYAVAIAGGGGFRMRFRERKAHPISIELDARYRRHGRVEYLREGGVRERPDGSIELETIASDANLWTLQVGALVGLR